MKASELRNHVNTTDKAAEAALVQEKIAKIKSAIVLQAKSKVQFFLDRMAKDGRDYGVDLKANGFEDCVREFLDTIPDEVISKGIFPQCCFIPTDKVTFQKGVFNFCLEASMPLAEDSDKKFFFPNTMKLQVMKNRLPLKKSDLVLQAKTKVQAFLERMAKDGNDYCVDLETAGFESYAKEFVDTIPDEMLSKGVCVRCSSISDDKVSFKRGVFNFSLEDSEPQEETSDKKNLPPYTIKVQVINYGQKMLRFYKNRLGLYPSNEFIKSTFAAMDSEGILKLHGMDWDDFLDLLEEKDGDAEQITERVYAYCQEDGVYIACCNVPLPDILRKNEPYVFDIRYVPAKKVS